MTIDISFVLVFDHVNTNDTNNRVLGHTFYFCANLRSKAVIIVVCKKAARIKWGGSRVMDHWARVSTHWFLENGRYHRGRPRKKW